MRNGLMLLFWLITITAHTQTNHDQLIKFLRAGDFNNALEHVESRDQVAGEMISWQQKLCNTEDIALVKAPGKFIKNREDTSSFLSRFLFHLNQGDYNFLSFSNRNIEARSSYQKAYDLARNEGKKAYACMASRRIIDIARYRYLADLGHAEILFEEYEEQISDLYDLTYLYYQKLILSYKYYNTDHWDSDLAGQLLAYTETSSNYILNGRILQLLSSYVHYEEADHQKAIEMALRAKSEIEKGQHPFKSVLLMISHIDLGIFHLANEDFETAETYFSQMAGVAGNKIERDYQRYLHFYMAQIDSVKGDYLSAYEQINRYLEKTQAVDEQSQADELAELRIAMRVEQQQRILEIRNIWLVVVAAFSLLLIILAFVLYRTALKVRYKNNKIETLMRELHHRVKNNLQVISSLLGLQSMRLKDKEAKKAVSEGKGRIRAMSLIHQKLYQNEEFTSIDIREYLSNLVNELKTAYGFHDRAELNIEVPARRMDADSALPIGLIINELVSNAFKYAFNGIKKPRLELRLKEEHNNLWLMEVSDNGTGLPEGIYVEEADSFGMKLVNLLVRQLKGTIEIKHDQGLAYFIRFKVDQ